MENKKSEDIVTILENIPAMPGNDKEYIISCTDANEWEVALDYMCCKIEDCEINITTQVYALIKTFGENIELDENERLYWTPLEDYIIE